MKKILFQTALSLLAGSTGLSQSLSWSFDQKPKASELIISSFTTHAGKPASGFHQNGLSLQAPEFCKTELAATSDAKTVTLSALIHPTAYPAGKFGNAILTACNSASPEKMLYSLHMQNDRLRFAILNRCDDGTLQYYGVTATTPLPLNQWTHVTAVRQKDGLYLYMNGALNNTRKLPGSIEPADVFYLCSEQDLRKEERYFNGTIDNVSLEYTALTSEKIARKYAKFPSTGADPVTANGGLYYPLELSAPSEAFPDAPARVALNLQFMQACLDGSATLHVDDLYVCTWDKAKKRPAPSPVKFRITSDLLTKTATVGFKRIPGIRDYAIGFSKNKPAPENEIPLIGAGEPISVGRRDTGMDAAQGCAGYPAVVDFDGDGDKDLIVSFVFPRRMFLYENQSGSGTPHLGAPKMIFQGQSMLNFDIHQEEDGSLFAYSANNKNAGIAWEGHYEKTKWLDLWRRMQTDRGDRIEKIETIPVAGLPENCRLFDVVLQDADGDGVKDLLVGVLEGTWWWPKGIDPWNRGAGSPYIGYGKGYDEQNHWLGAAPTGTLYLAKNNGSNQKPEFEKARIMTAAGKPIKMPTNQLSPCLVDLNKDGTLDLLLATGVDNVLAFYNTSRTPGEYQFKQPVNALLETEKSNRFYFDSRFELTDWDNDGEDEILVCSNPGLVVKCEIVDGKLVEDEVVQCYGANVWAETLATATVTDMNHDGRWDIIAGDSSGYLNFYPNSGTTLSPLFSRRELLKSGEQVFQALAGYSGSIQGPEEARWGYLAPSVCDWDGDGDNDIVTSDVTGCVYWLANHAKTTGGIELGKPVPLEIDGWPLKVRWRTRPAIFRDENDSPFLITSDPDGFLAMYKRDWIQGPSALTAGERLTFQNGDDIKIDGPSGYNGRNKFFATDWNSDGKTDLLIGQAKRGGIPADRRFDLPRTESATVILMLNEGSDSRPVFGQPEMLLLADGSDLPFGTHSCAPSTYDYDNDGHEDLFVGSEIGIVHCFNRSLFEEGSQLIQIPAHLKKP